MPPKASDFDRQMQQLKAEIKRLEAEYNMFFAGRLPRPPWETRAPSPKPCAHKVSLLGGGDSDVMFRVELKEGKATFSGEVGET